MTDFAERLATRSQLSIHAMKEIVDTISDGDDGCLAAVNAHWQEQMALSGEAETGIRAFMAKESGRADMPSTPSGVPKEPV